METRKETLSSLKVCRFCLSSDETLIPLYDNKVRAPKNSVPFALKILACIAIEIFPSDNMPQYICQRCKLFMELSYAFKQLCRQADEAILQFVQNGSPLTAMVWPTQLTKVYKAANKLSEPTVMKTVMQGGNTVKVMAEEVTDSEEGDDDNVYNVKIGDGSDDSKSIKIITSVNQSGSKRGRRGSPKNSEEAEILEVNQVESGCWACDECECTYSLEQLLSLHKAQKHRTRKESCEQCGGKFFSKYDLEVHMQTHSPDMPFECVACGKKFRRLILLKRHEKLMHSELPQQKCLKCPATYLSTEELEAHQQIHVRNTVKPFICSICHKRFHEKRVLLKHTALVHHKKSAFSCQYCPEQFPSVTKLTRHVKEHAGVRRYPCKHCDKSFTKSHHYTRHLRVKHNAILTAGPYTESEAYRCEECDDETFATHDELMYHSALHATRNLICPLCQEKFDDVDTVTAHIKSHVNGVEFMCDFCELIFTSKEKLENHTARAHDEELMANDQETENDESSMDMDAEEDYDDGSINVKEEDGHMVVEIKKAGEFMLPSAQREEEDLKTDNTQSEDSDAGYTDSPVTELEVSVPKQTVAKEITLNKMAIVLPKATTMPPVKLIDSNVADVMRKADEIKRKAQLQHSQQLLSAADKKEKVVPKVESSTAASGANDKSLRLLEKELQDLKRTNARPEAAKTPSRVVDPLRNRRPQLYTSTPKIRTEKKEIVVAKPVQEKTPVEKKVLERKPTNAKEMKSNNNSVKEDKEIKGNLKEDKEIKDEKKEVKEKETPKSVMKNGSDTSATEETVRRSTRPSKVKDYAKMIRDSSMISDDDESDQEDVEELKAPEKTLDTSRGRGRRNSNKSASVPTPVKPTPPAKSNDKSVTTTIVARKRGRPRKEPPQPVVPSKIKKDEPSGDDTDAESVLETKTEPVTPKKMAKEDLKENEPENIIEGSKTPEANKSPMEPKPGVIISPSGQTLKKVPVKALPPGVKPLPLPVNSRLGGGEVCEMQIGKKMVKVQKIVMTKAEVEAMAKKGLVEMKDGTMVLKQGIKLPASDPHTIKSSLVGDADCKKEYPKPEKPAPTRCDLD